MKYKQQNKKIFFLEKKKKNQTRIASKDSTPTSVDWFRLIFSRKCSPLNCVKKNKIIFNEKKKTTW